MTLVEKVSRAIALVALAAMFQIPNTLDAQEIAKDWPTFRGANSGVLKSIEHPLQWSNESNLAWSVDVAGGGWSSPIVSGDRVFLTTAVGKSKPVGFSDGVRNMRGTKPDAPLDFQVICFSLADGKKLWERTVTKQMPEHTIHPSNTYATESPACDGKNVFVYFAAIGLVASYDMEGNEVWRQSIGSFPTGNGFGTGSSLAMNDSKVFVQCDNDEASFIVALNKADGAEAWKKKRGGGTSWASPLVWKNKNRTELVTCGAGFVTSYNPDSGEQLWNLSGIGMSFSSSPASDQQRVYFGNSGPMSSGPLVAVGSDMSGEVVFDPQSPSDKLDWVVMQAGPGMTSPVAVGEYVYVASRNILNCYKITDGTRVFKSRLKLSTTAASMWGDGEHVFLIDENGKTIVIKVGGEELNIVHTNKVDDMFWSTPAVSGKSLLLRGVNKLFCIRGE